MSAQVVEDEDYQLRHERVAGIDAAKASGMVCLRLPKISQLNAICLKGYSSLTAVTTRRER
jgi:hypothetical protein